MARFIYVPVFLSPGDSAAIKVKDHMFNVDKIEVAGPDKLNSFIQSSGIRFLIDIQFQDLRKIISAASYISFAKEDFIHDKKE